MVSGTAVTVPSRSSRRGWRRRRRFMMMMVMVVVVVVMMRAGVMVRWPSTTADRTALRILAL